MKRLFLSLLVALIPAVGWGQTTVLQGGSWSAGLLPMYSQSGGSQPIVQNSGTAGGGAPGLGLRELNVTARGTGTAPFVGQGTGQLGTVVQIQDAPSTNSTGYHALSFSANAQGGGLIAYNAYGGAAALPLKMNINGSSYEFPFVLSGVVGPPTSTVGNLALWANTSGTLLSDGGPFNASAMPYTASPPDAVTETVQTALRRQFYVDQYGPPKNFSQTDSTAILNAITAAVNAGGGTVLLGASGYWSTLDITVPRGVTLACVGYAGKLTTGLVFTTVPCSIYFASGKSLFLNGELREVNIFNDIVHFTTPGATRASMTSYINSFSGRGIVLGNGVGNAANNASVYNVMVGGFATCIEIDNSMQIVLQDILMDCTNGVDISRSFDDNRMRNVQLWEFLTTNQSQTFQSWQIASMANNGVGLWRLVLSTTSDAQSGEQLWVGRGTGGQGTAGLWTLTRINSTTFDLQGSAFAPTATAATTDGSLYVTLDSVDNLQPGMTVTGSGIPANATIAAVWRTRNAISLAQGFAATATASGVALTFGSTAYTVNTATIAYDGTYRDGIGFRLGRADGTTCEGCFSFGNRIGFSFEGTVGVSFVNAQYDSVSKVANQNAVPIGFQFAGTQTYSNYVSGSLSTTGGINVLSNPSNSPGTYGNFISGMRTASAYNGSTALEVGAGQITYDGMSDGAVHNILLDAAAPTPILSSNAMTGTSLFGTGLSPLWAENNQFGGSLEYRYPSRIGAQSFLSATTSNPSFILYQSNQGADAKYWRMVAGNAGTACIQALNDAFNVATNALCATRTGGTVTGLNSATYPTFLNGTAVGAGANTQAFVKASTTANLGLYYGTGDPAFSAARGSIYMKTDASTNSTRLWVNTDGGTTWASFTSSS